MSARGHNHNHRPCGFLYTKMSPQAIWRLRRHGAGDRTRTGTLSPAVDFESVDLLGATQNAMNSSLQFSQNSLLFFSICKVNIQYIPPSLQNICQRRVEGTLIEF